MKQNNNYEYIGESFLDKIYKDLHLSEEVMHTASKSDLKNEKIRKYLNRLEKVENIAKASKYNGMELLKNRYYERYVIKPESVPDSYFKLQERIALEQGYGHISYSEKEKKEAIKIIVHDQKASLDVWLDYFLSDDAIYPEWFKYYAFQSMIRLGEYNKETETFSKRTASTTSKFVDLNHEALALVYTELVRVLKKENISDNILQQLLENGSFSKIYSYVLRKLEKGRKYIGSNDGIWIKYQQGSDPTQLVESIQGKGTGWCTAGIETARAQLQGGDFYVYYTKTSNENYEQPRIAIRMNGNSIGEIRGVAEKQNLEPEMEEVLNQKLEEFPDRDKYRKKVSDMKRLTKLYNSYKEIELTIDNLAFLYETSCKIEGFGYRKDPRIDEILESRNRKSDLAKIFGCSEDEISNDPNDIFKNKKIVFFDGNLDLSDLTSVEGLTLPNSIGGNLDLSSLTSAEGLTLPKQAGGSLYLSSLTSTKGLTFPKQVGRSLYLSSLTNAEGLTLPKQVGGSLDLSSLTSTKGLTFPKQVGGSLDLSSLTSTKGLTFPEQVGRSLDLSSLTSAEDVTFPKQVGRSLYLSSLTSAENVTFPNSIGGFLNLKSLTTLDGIIVPPDFSCSYFRSLYFTLEDLMNFAKTDDPDVKKR